MAIFVTTISVTNSKFKKLFYKSFSLCFPLTAHNATMVCNKLMMAASGSEGSPHMDLEIIFGLRARVWLCARARRVSLPQW